MWMSSQWKMLVVSLCAQLVGCKDDPSQMGDETSTGPGPTSETDDPTTMTANPETTLPDPDSGESSIGPVTETVTDTESTTTNDTQTATESESETAGGLGCVNEDLGSALGENVLSGTTVGEDSDLTNECIRGEGVIAIDYIVSWTAPAAGDYVFSLAGSSFDTALGIFDGDCSGPELACNDDCQDTDSVVGLELAADQVVLIAITGYDASSGAFELSITEEPVSKCHGFETDSESETATASATVTDTGDSTDPTSAGTDVSSASVADDG